MTDTKRKDVLEDVPVIRDCVGLVYGELGDDERAALANAALSELVQEIRELREALATCVRVFQSQADRGRYPEELLPETDHYIGVQGFGFATCLLPETGDPE